MVSVAPGGLRSGNFNDGLLGWREGLALGTATLEVARETAGVVVREVGPSCFLLLMTVELEFVRDMGGSCGTELEEKVRIGRKWSSCMLAL